MSSQLFSFLFFFFLRWQLLSVKPCGVFGEMGASLIHKWKVFDVSLRRGWGWGGKSPVFVLHCLSAQTSRSCCCLVPVRALGKKLKKAPSSC